MVCSYSISLAHRRLQSPHDGRVSSPSQPLPRFLLTPSLRSCKARIYFSGGFVEANVERPEIVVDIQNAIVAQRDAIAQARYQQESQVTLDQV